MIPAVLKSLKRRTESMRQYGKKGPEEMRQVASTIFSYENSIKAFSGQLSGLMDKDIFAKKVKEENDFRAMIAAKPEWQKEYGDAWDAVAAAKQKQADLFRPSFLRGLRGSRLAQMAVRIVQYSAEIKKPDSERMEGLHDAQLETFKFSLLSKAPIYPALEEFRLADGFREALDELGADDPFVKMFLSGRTPEEVAKEMIAGTKLADIEVRKALLEGGEKAISESKDPLIVAALKLDPMTREMNKKMGAEVTNVESVAGEKIGRARFAAYGTSLSPDANFTLRVTYGTVTGYPMNGTIAPPMTTFYGMYDRYHSFKGNPNFALPQRYIDGQAKIELSTPLNFVSTLDVVGGSSGSPVVNKQGELVGLVFDGNIESLVGTYVYDVAKNRTVAVDVRAMMEALRKLYDAGSLADELMKK
jgi:hypothetical protein